jgi:phosphoribosylamine--glycine ligase
MTWFIEGMDDSILHFIIFIRFYTIDGFILSTWFPLSLRQSTMMNVLLIGGGGREHALAWKMAQSPILGELFCSPGNPGTEQSGSNVRLDLDDFEEVARFLSDNSIELVVVGPEAPLVDGLHDRIEERFGKSVTVIGPKRAGATLEGSKDFSKAFMARHGIPTARYATFDSTTCDDGQAFLQTLSAPYVLKCDGLAAGKGVLIIDELAEAQEELKRILEGGAFGEAGAKVVIEEYLDGVELSVFVLTDGKDYLLLPTAKDYKRIGEGDIGPNTGGMGALSPAPVADSVFMKRVEDEIIEPTLAGLASEGIPYVGFLFIGLMNVDEAPQVIEYNVRMGDPETEVVMPRLESDLLAHFKAISEGRLAQEEIHIRPESATTVMMVSAGYPGSYEKGKMINISGSDSEDALLFHAGTKQDGGALRTSGGRVITSTALGQTMAQALEKSYAGVERVSFEGKTYRKDIGYELKS